MGPRVEALIESAMNDVDLSSRLRAIESLEPYLALEARVREIVFNLAHHDNNAKVRKVASALLEEDHMSIHRIRGSPSRPGARGR